MKRSIKNIVSSELGKAILQGMGLGVLLGLVFAGGYFYRGFIDKPGNSDVSLELLQEADALLAEHYLYSLPADEDRVYGAISGLVASTNDPYTYFVEPQTAEVDASNLAGRFGGIGAEIGMDEQGRFVIGRVYRDNPAYEAGLETGDIILTVDEVRVSSEFYDIDGVVSLIRGDVGDPVVLRVERSGEEIEIEIIRDEVLIPSTFWQVVEIEERIGHIQITRFTDRTPDEIKQALAELDEQDVQAYIVDLRQNGGGLLDSAVEVAGEFLSGGVVLYEERSSGEQIVKNASRGGQALESPLVVLINNGTASASEILAGALHDRDRATLIGQPSYGKGSVQLIVSLSDGSSLHVTSAQWFTPEQYRIEGQGLQPDIVTEPTPGTDADVEAAVAHLVEQLENEG